MTQQTEAQRLAAALDKAPYSSPCTNDAAAELRRLDAELERKSDAIQRLWKERDDLGAVNAQLLKALLEYKRLYEEVQPAGGWQGVYEIGNAAIAAAKGQA